MDLPKVGLRKKKFTDLYSKSLQYYKQKFNQDPPTDLWPPIEIRFRPSDCKRIDLNRNWIIKKPFK